MTTNSPSHDKFYVSTPIYYINDRPHIGHAYSTIAADSLARYWRSKLGAKNVLFSTGTDENSKKTIEAAHDAGQDIAAYTNDMATLWRSTWDKLGISYDQFIRTSDAQHKVSVDQLVTKIHEAGDISKGQYEGPYCFRCEAFYKTDELVDGLCPIHKKDVEIVKEDNYFFDLPKYADQLKELITSGEFEIQPVSRRNEVLAFIDRGLEPISISRANQEIGLVLPFDGTQKIYVWVEALINYLTAAGYPDKSYSDWWQNVTHIVGKDIIKFHCIIWPAMLLSAGVGLPKRVFAHGFFTIDGEKISKSLGNSIDPIELAEKYGTDALRYYLLREIPFGTDGNFSTDRFAQVYASELANNLGNLTQRIAVMLTKYAPDTKLDMTKKHPSAGSLDRAIENLEFASLAQELQRHFDRLNTRLEKEKPWTIAKSDPKLAGEIIIKIAEELISVMPWLTILLPETAEKLSQTFADGQVNLSVGVLFPRVELETE